MKFPLLRARPTSAAIVLPITGSMVALQVFATFYATLRTGGPSDTLVLQWLLAGLVVPVVLAWLAFGDSVELPFARRIRELSRRASGGAIVVLGAAALACALWIAFADNRRYMLFIVLIQALLSYRCFRARVAGIRFFTVLGVACVSWLLSIGMCHVPLANLFLGALPETNLVPVMFVVTLLAVSFEFVPTDRPAFVGFDGLRAAAYVAAIAFFLWQGLRTDHLFDDWIPYHRSYFVDPAEFIRQGHWLLWDVPSQYGLLSEAAIAVMPVGSAWQGLHLVTALILTLQAAATFTVFRQGVRTLRNYIVAIALAGAANFSANGSRIPFGDRLYPQGGMRFIFVIAIMFVAYRMYRTNDARVRSRLRLAGTILWAVSCFWALECAIWSTVAWVGFLVAEYVVDVLTSETRVTRGDLVLRIAALVVAPVALFGGIESWYALRLHHLPDWLGYIEFNSVYAQDSSYHVPISTFGSGWTFVALLAGAGSLIVAVTRERRYRAIPILVCAWLAIWVTASYYCGEPYDNHINILAPVLAMAVAICIVVADLAKIAFTARAVTALAFVPFAVIVIASSVTGTKPLLETRGPFLGPHSFSAVAGVRLIPPELARLEAKAGIGMNDEVLFPSSVRWVKYDNGMVSPFVANPEPGKDPIEQLGWLPYNSTGMINTMVTLPVTRRFTYIERYLASTRTGGWYVTYQEQPDCSSLSPHLENGRIYRTLNYFATKCRYRSKPVSPVAY